MLKNPGSLVLLVLLVWLPCGVAADEGGPSRVVAGVVTAEASAGVAGATLVARSQLGERRCVTDASGRFRLTIPGDALTLRVEGAGIEPRERALAPGEPTEDLDIRVSFAAPRLHEAVVVVAAPASPLGDHRDGTFLREAVFSRDDQLLHALGAGISAGQHEGGGKSLEVRRFGLNLDHGGLSGGLRVLVDDVPQNQATQAHGQGYLGELKHVIPELIDEVEVTSGPFSARHGDFSGLGVVHLRYRDRLADPLTLRLQAGSFDSRRGFLGWSPRLRSGEALLAYEGSRTDGPFLSPLRYARDNLAASYVRAGESQQLGVRLTAGRNGFRSSGQIPLDEVAAGRLDRFGFLDPDNGGRSRSGTLALHYRRALAGGATLRATAYASRSLFDLYSNFTFFFADETNGDEVQQHDSRLQQGAEVELSRPHRLLGREALGVAGGNVALSQIRVGLSPSVGRRPTGVSTLAHVDLANAGAYVQETLGVVPGRLVLHAGLRYDAFGFDLEDLVSPAPAAREAAGRLQPKAGLLFTPWRAAPLTLHLNYGRGIASQDARGIVRRPDGPKLSTSDFYQAGVAGSWGGVALSSDLFLIDRSSEQVYVPDDGSIELRGPSRAYGFEIRAGLRLGRTLGVSGGLTRVVNAFYRGTAPRLYVDSAPHTVGNVDLMINDWRRVSASLRYRHVSNYRLSAQDARVRASGQDVLDLGLRLRLSRHLALDLAIDNLTNDRYYETQNYFESRLQPGDPAVARIHGTPGYPRAVTLGLMLRLPGRMP